MILTEEKLIEELSRIIEISCSGNMQFQEFTNFHKAIIKIAYNANDISVDYDRKRVHMNVIVDTYKDEAPKLPMNLSYRNLGEFLKACIFLDTDTIMQYTFLLMGTASKNKVQIAESNFA